MCNTACDGEVDRDAYAARFWALRRDCAGVMSSSSPLLLP